MYKVNTKCSPSFCNLAASRSISARIATESMPLAFNASFELISFSDFFRCSPLWPLRMTSFVCAFCFWMNSIKRRVWLLTWCLSLFCDGFDDDDVLLINLRWICGTAYADDDDDRFWLSVERFIAALLLRGSTAIACVCFTFDGTLVGLFVAFGDNFNFGILLREQKIWFRFYDDNCIFLHIFVCFSVDTPTEYR